MKLLAIDPGSQKSAWLIYGDDGIVDFGIYRNEDLESYIGIRKILRSHNLPDLVWDHVAVEYISSYGQRVGRSVFETLFWAGRFVGRWGSDNWTPIYRKEVVKFLCGKCGNDKAVRAAIIERFGETDPPTGRLKHVIRDIWAALGVALYWTHLHEQEMAEAVRRETAPSGRS